MTVDRLRSMTFRQRTSEWAAAFWRWRAATHLYRAACAMERAGDLDDCVVPFEHMIRIVKEAEKRQRARVGLTSVH